MPWWWPFKKKEKDPKILKELLKEVESVLESSRQYLERRDFRLAKEFALTALGKAERIGIKTLMGAIAILIELIKTEKFEESSNQLATAKEIIDYELKKLN